MRARCRTACRTLRATTLAPSSSTRAGIWRYDANKTDQVFSPKERYATGIRNGEGFDFDAAGRLYVTQHGRDQLHEELARALHGGAGLRASRRGGGDPKEGADYGWPNCYYDATQKKLVLAPEYGGDGGKKAGECEKFDPPVAAFPRTGRRTISRSTRARSSRRDTMEVLSSPSMALESRARSTRRLQRRVPTPIRRQDSGDITSCSPMASRASPRTRAGSVSPLRLAVGLDGALYITDDKAGRIWRVTYIGDPNVKEIQAAPALPPKPRFRPAAFRLKASSPMREPIALALPVPPGATSDQVALGKKIFHGEVVGATCAGCHGADGTGTPVGADLTSGNGSGVTVAFRASPAPSRRGVPTAKAALRRDASTRRRSALRRATSPRSGGLCLGNRSRTRRREMR